MEDASGSTAVAAASPPAASAASPPRPLQLQHSLDLSSRADSANSSLSQGSGSGGSEPPGGGGGGVQRAGSARASIDLERAPSTSSDGGLGPVKVDARSAALKALAGASAIVSKSRKVDAEALQAIKSQRAKARAEGHVPSATGTLSTAASGNLGRVTPPPGAAPADTGTGISPFATASSQGMVRSPSGGNLPLGAAGLSHAASLPAGLHGGGARGAPRRSPPGGQSSAQATEYDAMVSKMTITELVALKQAVEGQLAKQALALAQLQAPAAAAAPAAGTDMLSQQYAALLLQNAQQAQLVQQLSSQQQAAHAAAIQQALSAAAAAAGITSSTFSPEQLLPLGGAGAGPGSNPLSAYASMPLPDMASPFASASYPPDAGFGLADAGQRGSISLPPGPLAGSGSKGSGSPRSASAEQQLIGEALHSFVDPERQGPPSRQGSALVNGINWSDRRSGAPGGPGGAPSSSAFARSRSMPHGPQPDAGLYHDRSASLSQFLGDGDAQQLGSLFNGLGIGGDGGAAPVSAFAAARSGSLQVPGVRHGHSSGAPLPPAHMKLSPTSHQVSFADQVHQRNNYPQGGY